MENLYFRSEENEIAAKFLQDGYVIFPLDEAKNATLSLIRKEIFEFGKAHLNLSSVTENEFFDQTHKFVPKDKLNDFKLKVMALVASNFKHHPGIYHLAKTYLDYIVGNELCMQRGLNLSIQLPQDDSALLPLHTDVWSGNSPYEVVLWLPLVDCYRSKSMYVLPLQKSLNVIENFDIYKKLNAEDFYKKLEKDMVFLEVPKGHAVIFSHSILHGNRVNKEADTRWTFNIRFKSVMSPFGMKDLGETFIPINLRPITRIGFNYKLPDLGNA